MSLKYEDVAKMNRAERRKIKKLNKHDFTVPGVRVPSMNFEKRKRKAIRRGMEDMVRG